MLTLMWAHTTELFKKLAHLNLTPTSSVEAAYKRDNKLLWHFASCQARLNYYLNSLWWNLRLEISWSEHFHCYFKQSHVCHCFFHMLFGELTIHQWKDGIAKIETDNSYVQKHGYNSTLDELVIAIITDSKVHHSKFLDPLQRLMVSISPNHHPCWAAPLIAHNVFSLNICLKLQSSAPRHLRHLVILQLPSLSMRSSLVLPSVVP